MVIASNFGYIQPLSRSAHMLNYKCILETAPLPRARGKLGGMQKRNLRNKNKGPIGHNIINNVISCHKVI